MFINLCEPISAVEKSPYSGMQCRIRKLQVWNGLLSDEAQLCLHSSSPPWHHAPPPAPPPPGLRRRPPVPPRWGPCAPPPCAQWSGGFSLAAFCTSTAGRSWPAGRGSSRLLWTVTTQKTRTKPVSKTFSSSCRILKMSSTLGWVKIELVYLSLATPRLAKETCTKLSTRGCPSSLT